MAKKKEITSIQDLTLDDLNFNKHTAEGMKLLEKSISENKFGRSVLADKDGNLIAGNGVVETAQKLGKTKIKVVQTEGDELVVVQRMDLDIDSKEARELAILDNSAAYQNLNWDSDKIKEAADKYDIPAWQLQEWGVDLPDFKEVELSEEELQALIKHASAGSIEDYNEDTKYNLKNLYRRKGNKEVEKLLNEGILKGQVKPAIAKLCQMRLAQCTLMNFDEIIKYYRSEDCSDTERELLKRLYLVFITPKETIESAMLQMEATTGRIFEMEFTENAEEE